MFRGRGQGIKHTVCFKNTKKTGWFSQKKVQNTLLRPRGRPWYIFLCSIRVKAGVTNLNSFC